MKSTLLRGAWVRGRGKSPAFLALTGALLVSSCADEAREVDSATGGASEGTSGGASAGMTAGGTSGSSAGAASGSNGATTAGTTTGTGGGASAGAASGSSSGSANGTTGDAMPTTAGDDSDAGMTVGGATGDLSNTPGNDSPSATACKGSDHCSYATQTCCVQGVGDAMCIEGKKCPTGGLFPSAPTVCDGPEDCAGNKVCCVAVNPNGAANSCQDSCSKVTGLIGVWQLCHKDDDCPASKGACEADDTFPFWGFCN